MRVLVDTDVVLDLMLKPVVSNTSPLINLARVSQVDLPQQLSTGIAMDMGGQLW